MAQNNNKPLLNPTLVLLPLQIATFILLIILTATLTDIQSEVTTFINSTEAKISYLDKLNSIPDFAPQINSLQTNLALLPSFISNFDEANVNITSYLNDISKKLEDFDKRLDILISSFG